MPPPTPNPRTAATPNDAASSDATPNHEQDTKARLLEAGREVFAEYGYATASIRQICNQASANPAAINYHFGDKKRFYAEVLATCHIQATQRRPIPRLAEFDQPDKALQAWIHWFLELLIVDGAGPLGRLMAREMAEPTGALDELIRRSMAPMMATLNEIVTALLPNAELETRQLCVQSIVGQCLFYRHAEAAFESVERLMAQGQFPADAPALIARATPERLADHIATFSLAGLSAVASAHGDPA